MSKTEDEAGGGKEKRGGDKNAVVTCVVVFVRANGKLGSQVKHIILWHCTACVLCTAHSVRYISLWFKQNCTCYRD